jgi:glycosyltransferase involved in cell wall biosynthesis
VSSRAPTFSVVMPAYNTASMIGDAIASVLAQTRQDFELLVVDDGSDDGTPDVVRRFADDPRVDLLVSGPKAGPGAARNAAIERARGRYVSMLDSDDLWLPTYLEAIGDALDRHASAGLACTLSWTLDDPPGLLRRSARDARGAPEVLDADAFLARLAERNFVVNSTVTLRRSLAVELGGCNSALPAAVDFDLWLRVAAAGHGAVLLREPLAVYRVRRGSIQNEPANELRAHVAIRNVYRAVAEEWAVPEAVRAVARERVEMLDRRIAILDGRRRTRAALLAARRRGGRVKRVVLRRRLWYPEPPTELREALPSLAARRGDGAAT